MLKHMGWDSSHLATRGACSVFNSLSGPCTSRFLAEGHFPVPKGVHEGWDQESSRDFAILVTIEKAQATLRLNT